MGMQEEPVDKLVGRKFRVRKFGQQETRLVIDYTLGGDVVFKFGPRLCWQKQNTWSKWNDWFKDAVEIFDK